MRCPHCGNPGSHDHLEQCEVEELELGELFKVCAFSGSGSSSESDAAEDFVDRFQAELEAKGGDVYHVRARKVGAEGWKYFQVAVEVSLYFNATDDNGEAAAAFEAAEAEAAEAEAKGLPPLRQLFTNVLP